MTTVGLLYVMVLLLRRGYSRIARCLSGLSLVGIITVFSPQYASSSVARESAYRITYVQDNEAESAQEDPWASPVSNLPVSSVSTSTPTPSTTSLTSPTSMLTVATTSPLPIENRSESQSENASRPSSPPQTEAPHVVRESYRVVAGDNLWTIARAHIRPGESVEKLWKTIIAENISILRSKNPNLIYPGEEIILSHHQ